MFCKNCGEKLEPHQKFCISCGSVVLDSPDAPQPRAEENQVSSTVRSVPVYDSKPINAGEPGLHSKRCFVFAIVSLVLAGAGLIYGGGNVMRLLSPYYYYYPYYSFGLGGFTIAVVLNITGLIFGILSKTNSSKAKKFEPINTLRKVGGIFSIFGIVLNSIPVAVVAVILIILLISLLI